MSYEYDASISSTPGTLAYYAPEDELVAPVDPSTEPGSDPALEGPASEPVPVDRYTESPPIVPVEGVVAVDEGRAPGTYGTDVDESGRPTEIDGIPIAAEFRPGTQVPPDANADGVADKLAQESAGEQAAQSGELLERERFVSEYSHRRVAVEDLAETPGAQEADLNGDGLIGSADLDGDGQLESGDSDGDGVIGDGETRGELEAGGDEFGALHDGLRTRAGTPPDGELSLGTTSNPSIAGGWVRGVAAASHQAGGAEKLGERNLSEVPELQAVLEGADGALLESNAILPAGFQGPQAGVGAVQDRLIQLGFDINLAEGDDPDAYRGLLGQGTSAALNDFRMQHGVVDYNSRGDALSPALTGANTLRALDFAAEAQSTRGETLNPEDFTGLAVGDEGEQVQALQRRLTDYGFPPKDLFNEDGSPRYGELTPETERMLSSFQGANAHLGLAPTALEDPENLTRTLEALSVAPEFTPEFGRAMLQNGVTLQGMSEQETFDYFRGVYDSMAPEDLPFDERAGAVNLVTVRGMVEDAAVQNADDQMNDTTYALIPGGPGKENRVVRMLGSADPGNTKFELDLGYGTDMSHSGIRPMGDLGNGSEALAITLPGVYSMEYGAHVASPKGLPVNRGVGLKDSIPGTSGLPEGVGNIQAAYDIDRNGSISDLERSYPVQGWAEHNLHRGNTLGETVTGGWSAGCHPFATGGGYTEGGNDYATFTDLVTTSTQVQDELGRLVDDEEIDSYLTSGAADPAVLESLVAGGLLEEAEIGAEWNEVELEEGVTKEVISWDQEKLDAWVSDWSQADREAAAHNFMFGNRRNAESADGYIEANDAGEQGTYLGPPIQWMPNVRFNLAVVDARDLPQEFRGRPLTRA